jgi:hypothetical protein
LFVSPIIALGALSIFIIALENIIAIVKCHIRRQRKQTLV